MIGLDSNVVVRLLTADDIEQAGQAERMIASAGPRGSFISVIVLVETVLTLKSIYGLDRHKIAAALENLLLTEEFSIGSREHVVVALAAYAGSNADFADALIGEVNLAAGCSATATFDRKAARLKGFRRVP